MGYLILMKIEKFVSLHEKIRGPVPFHRGLGYLGLAGEEELISVPTTNVIFFEIVCSIDQQLAFHIEKLRDHLDDLGIDVYPKAF